MTPLFTWLESGRRASRVMRRMNQHVVQTMESKPPRRWLYQKLCFLIIMLHSVIAQCEKMFCVPNIIHIFTKPIYVGYLSSLPSNEPSPIFLSPLLLKLDYLVMLFIFSRCTWPAVCGCRTINNITKKAISVNNGDRDVGFGLPDGVGLVEI